MSEFPFSKEEIKFLRRNLPDKRLAPSDLIIWKKAFDFYNRNQPEGRPHYHMGCRPCYYKVLSFLLKMESLMIKEE